MQFIMIMLIISRKLSTDSIRYRRNQLATLQRHTSRFSCETCQ